MNNNDPSLNFNRSKSLNDCNYGGSNLEKDSQGFQKSNSWSKYKGNTRRRDDRLINLRKFHNLVKEYYISRFCKNSFRVIDIGSGRGSDIKHYNNHDVKFLLGIEPSETSIKKSIGYLNQLKDDQIVQTRVFYLNGFGHLKWSNGLAAARDKDILIFKRNFGANSKKARNINMFWTIHYMMNNRDEFNMLMFNICNNISKNGTVIILCMDGEKIDHLLSKNNGLFEVRNQNNHPIFSIKCNVDKNKTFINSKLGNKIEVKMADTYGLKKGIDENLVYKDFLIDEFKNHGFRLEKQQRFLDVEIEQKEKLEDYERQISDLYLALVFKKI